MEMLHAAERQRAHDVGLVHKAVAHAHRVEAFADFIDFETPVVEHVRHILGVDLHHHDALVQRLVVL